MAPDWLQVWRFCRYQRHRRHTYWSTSQGLDPRAVRPERNEISAFIFTSSCILFQKLARVD